MSNVIRITDRARVEEKPGNESGKVLAWPNTPETAHRHSHPDACRFCVDSGRIVKGLRLWNIGRDHWSICYLHRVKWYIGSNLYSNWEHEDEATWRANAEELANYRDVDEWPGPRAS